MRARDSILVYMKIFDYDSFPLMISNVQCVYVCACTCMVSLELNSKAFEKSVKPTNTREEQSRGEKRKEGNAGHKNIYTVPQLCS